MGLGHLKWRSVDGRQVIALRFSGHDGTDKINIARLNGFLNVREGVLVA
jgi:hypothetical protein